MRDPKRIHQILSELEEYWNERPDLRFFQMLASLRLSNPTPDLFYYEDDKLLSSLESLNKGDDSLG